MKNYDIFAMDSPILMKFGTVLPLGPPGMVSLSDDVVRFKK